MGKQKAANGSGSIRKKVIQKNGREYIYWEARYTIGKNPATGKQIQKSISGKTQREVREKMQKACVELNDGRYIEPMKLTVAEWMNHWLQNFLRNTKESTAVSYRTICQTHIIPAIGNIPIQQLTTEMLQQFLNDLIDEKLLSPKTVRNVHGVLHRALEQAVQIKYIYQNPAAHCNLPRVKKEKIQGLDDKGITRFLAVVQGNKYKNVFMLALFTGMRQGEILGLTWDCVDFDAGTITIKQQLQQKRDGSGAWVLVQTKTGKDRIIAMSQEVLKILTEQREISNSPFVFSKEDGKNLCAGTVRHSFKQLAVEAGYPNLRFHDLRHCFAVVSLRAGDDVKTVQENLGHYSAAFTLDVYGYVTAQMREESAENIQQYIEHLKREK